MTPLPHDVSDEQILRFVDGWAALLEAEDYQAAYDYTDHVPRTNGGAEWLRASVKLYGRAAPGQRVTVAGEPTGGALWQRKEVERWPVMDNGSAGDVLYDLNIDGVISDLSATFYLAQTDGGLAVELIDIEVL